MSHIAAQKYLKHMTSEQALTAVLRATLANHESVVHYTLCIPIVICQLCVRCNLLTSKERNPVQQPIASVSKDRLYYQVAFARMVDESGHIP